jgi:hypothetical protein
MKNFNSWKYTATKKKAHKYGARRTKCVSGHNHPSMLESDYCDKLTFLLGSGEIKAFEYGKRFELYVNGKFVGGHKPDFLVTLNNNVKEVHETKGVVTADFSLRKNLFEALYPNIKYIVIRKV